MIAPHDAAGGPHQQLENVEFQRRECDSLAVAQHFARAGVDADCADRDFFRRAVWLVSAEYRANSRHQAAMMSGSARSAAMVPSQDWRLFSG